MSFSLFSVLLAGSAGFATASTPPNFEPSSSQNLIVAFGSTTALNGVVVPRALTATAPSLFTAEKLSGSFTVMMLDPDVPSGPGTKTSELLHWMQSDLTSASNPTTIAGKQVYQLINANNASAIASYLQPSPPQKIPLSHRYVQIILNTTDPTSKATLAKFGATRQMFNATSVLAQAAVQPLFGNSFNVTFNDSNVGTGPTMSLGGAPSFAGARASSALLGAALAGLAALL